MKPSKILLRKKDIIEKIEECLTIKQLLNLYKQNPDFQQSLKEKFQSKKQQLELLSNPQNFSNNGNSISKKY